jgi:transposase
MISVSLPVAPENSAFAAFVGIDWADQKHDLVLFDQRGEKPEHRELIQTSEAIDEWACGLRQRFSGRPIAVCFEQSRGGIAYALLMNDFLVLFPLPPARLASYRESFSNSGAKDDPTDAALLVDYLLRHRDQLRVWQPDTPVTRELQLLAEARRDAVDQRTRLSNQLTAVLKRYYPQALVLVGHDVDGPLACDFLSKWPSLAAVQAAAAPMLRKFYYAHHSRKAIEKYEARLSELMEQHPDATLFRALPGAGPALAPRLLVAFGSDRNRFQSAAELQTYSGVAPVTKRSGKQCNIHRRWACPRFLL